MYQGISTMSIQSNLKYLLDKQNLNANSLSEISRGELAQPTTRRILSGESENIRDKTLEKYAAYFKVPLSILKYGDVSKDFLTINTESDTHTQPLSIWDADSPLNNDDVAIPYFKEVLFSSGSGCTQVIEDTGTTLRFSKKTLVKAGIDPLFAACAKNYGDSMDKTIPDGATIGIDKSKQLIKDGKIYAFDHGGLLRVKRLYKLPFGAIRVVSDNPSYPDEMISSENWQTDVRLLGWVFWWSAIEKW